MSKRKRYKHLPISRARKRGLTIFFTLVLVALFLGGKLRWFPSSLEPDHQRYHDKVFRVTKVVDGDTLDLDISDPQAGKPYTRVRLWGVDTPETKHPQRGQMYFGPQAADFTLKLALGQNIRISLEPYENTRGKYGRLLAYVFLPDGRMLNEVLIREGYGYADSRFKHMLRSKFLRLQKEAQRDHRGLWLGVRPDQWPDWYRRRNQPDDTKPAGAEKI